MRRVTLVRTLKGVVVFLAALAALFESPVWYPALLKGLESIPGLYGKYLRLAARRKSPALACLPLRLRGAK